MVLALVVGDLHVPERAAGIPEAFRKMFSPGRIQYVFITGNVVCKDMFDYLRSIAPEVYCTRGECDGWGANLPDTITVEVEGVRIGLTHGHQVIPSGDRDSLAAVQRRLNVDVVISGATHIPKVHEFDSFLFINPGSSTGAFTHRDPNVVPSFVLLDIKDKSITVFTYLYEPDVADNNTLKGENSVRIKKKEWTKP